MHNILQHKTVIRKSGSPFRITKGDVQRSIEKKRPIEDYLSNKVPMQSDKLKIRLIKEGYLEPKCYNCGRTDWEGQEIALQLSHKDGNKNNNGLRNLELLCPNCHSQTSEWKLKNEFKGKSPSNKSKGNRNTDV